MSYLIALSVLVLLVGLYFIFRKFITKHETVFAKIFSLSLAGLLFVWYFASTKNELQGVVGLNGGEFSSGFIVVITSISIWFFFISNVAVSMYPYFNKDILKNYCRWFAPIGALLAFICLPNIIYAYTGGNEYNLCSIVLEINVAVLLAYSVYIFIKSGCFKATKREVIEFFCALPIILIVAIPPFLPRALFGDAISGNVKGFSLNHRLYLYLAFIFLIGLYLILRKKDRSYCRMALLFISLVTLISYCYDYDFSRFITPTRWPLHLCNTAMFIVPICLLFRWEKLFYFTFFINVLGAFFAMLMPNSNDADLFTYASVVRFWINHICALAMPVLIVLLRVYDRPKLRQFIYSMVGFLVYFVFVLIMNAWFTNFDSGVDFFFINSDFIAEKLGKWAEDLREITATLYVGGLPMVFYPVYQLLFFLVYVLLGLVMWFLYTWLFGAQDVYDELSARNKKIKLDAAALCVKYGKHRVGECVMKDSVNKLVINNVYKSYGSNKFYSVEDVSMTVNSGEIFGFLGPNGAGKSTIIKCIVGIQPASKGCIEINGYDIARQPVEAKSQFGFVPDHYALYEKLTGREYINYIADLYNVDHKDREERLNKLLDDLSMRNSIDNQIRTYSHGMKQKIAIMSALIHNPKLWILDEPLTGLDPTSIYQVKECMKEHAKKGNIVFFSSHIIDIVEKLCDRIMIIKKGKIKAEVTLKELKDRGETLEQFYLKIINSKDEQNSAVEKDNSADEVIEDKWFTKKPKTKRRGAK
ncbi:MAG: YwaF family protein [Clostridia bacterium]|nr:YwaF family protein [Clostridia bacterium]